MKTYDSDVYYEELNVLTNLIPESRWKISYPLYDFDMIEVRSRSRGYELELQNNLEFERNLENFTRKKNELPDYYDLRSCMTSSGILDIANIVQVKQDVLRHEKAQCGVRFGLDTNMLYSNFIKNHDLIDAREVILPETVKDELKHGVNRKYSGDDIEMFKNCAMRNQRSLDELKNKRVKYSRKSALALREWEYLKENDAQIIDAVREASHGEGECDQIIVESLKAHEEKIGQNVVLLTADDGMIDLCKIENLKYIKCDLNHRVESIGCDYVHLRNLLYDLSKVFGFIKFGPTIVYGEYGGYSSNDPDRLKVVTENYELHKELEKELKTCRKLKKIGIVK